MILPSPPPFATACGLLALVAYAAGALLGERLSDAQGRKVLLTACVLHALQVAASLVTPQGGPQFGFAPALSATAWLVMLAYTLEHHWYPQLRTRWTLYSLGGAALLLALLYPGQALHPSASAWLPLHWVLGMASYGLFAAAVVHAWLMNRAEQQFREAAENSTGLPLLTLERLTFRFAGAGFVLLTATLLAGWIFGDTLYGTERSLKWDHKTLFSVLAWCAFALLLVGRWRLGWRGRKATRVLYAGAVLLLLSYAGSRFVLQVILNRGL